MKTSSTYYFGDVVLWSEEGAVKAETDGRQSDTAMSTSSFYKSNIDTIKFNK